MYDRRKKRKIFATDYFALFAPLCGHISSVSGTRAAGFVTIFAEHRAPDFRLKRNGVMPSAIIANHFVPFRCIFALGRFFRTALRTPLRRHHVSLIKDFLIFFAKYKYVLALDTRNFYVRHT